MNLGLVIMGLVQIFRTFTLNKKEQQLIWHIFIRKGPIPHPTKISESIQKLSCHLLSAHPHSSLKLYTFYMVWTVKCVGWSNSAHFSYAQGKWIHPKRKLLWYGNIIVPSHWGVQGVLLKERIYSLWEQILSLESSPHFQTFWFQGRKFLSAGVAFFEKMVTKSPGISIHLNHGPAEPGHAFDWLRFMAQSTH